MLVRSENIVEKSWLNYL